MHGDGKNQKSWKIKQIIQVEGGKWIHSSLQIIYWLRLSKQWNLSSMLQKCSRSPNNDECQYSNWKCILRKCNACTYIALPGVERDSSNREPMIMFNMYVTQSTCSHHGILIHKKITTYLDAKGTYKNTCFLCEHLIQSKTPDFTRGILYKILLFPH